MTQKRRVILILNNCTAHNIEPKLGAVNLKFLPANTTVKSQPLDQSVMATVKALYKKRICEQVLLHLQRKEPLKVDLRAAIDMIMAAWWQVKPSTIKKCFEKEGFIRNHGTDVPTDDSDDQPVCADEVWSEYITNHVVSESDTTEDFLKDIDDDADMCEKAATDEYIVAVVRGDEDEAALESVTGFDASAGWLFRFHQRNGIIWQVVSGEEKAANKEGTNSWWNDSFREMAESFSEDDLFPPCETACFYQLLPDQTMRFQGQQCKGGKKSHLHKTVLLCCNASGTENQATHHRKVRKAWLLEERRIPTK